MCFEWMARAQMVLRDFWALYTLLTTSHSLLRVFKSLLDFDFLEIIVVDLRYIYS